MTAIEFVLNQRHDIHTVHREVPHQGVDLDIDQHRPNEAGPDQGHFTKLRAVEPAIDEPCLPEIIALERGHP